MQTVNEAAKALSISKASVRNYVERYGVYLSETATPGPGLTRRFTNEDMALLKHVADKLKAGHNHEHILETIEADIAALPDWAEKAQQSESPVSDAIVPIEQYRALQVLAEDKAQREQVALDRVQELQDRVNQLNMDLGKAEGKAEQLEKENTRLGRAWWKKLIGVE